MKLNRKDVYRVKTGAVYDVNEFGTKTKCQELNTFYCIPVRNTRGKIITLNEVLTNQPLVKRVYAKNECYDDDYEEMYYSYAYDKTRDVPQIGDVEVRVDQNYDTEELVRYVANKPETVKRALDTLEIRAIEQTCDGYSPDHNMNYYNEKLYICSLDEDFIIVSARPNILGNISGFREIITKRKVIKRYTDDYSETDYLINLNHSLHNPEIENINLSVLATRDIPADVVDSYMKLTPEEVEAKISRYLAKLSRERVIDYQSLTK